MPSNEKQLNETMSGQELENKLVQEVEYFKSAGDSLGFACSSHEHIVYPGGTDVMGYFKWLINPLCHCGAKATKILVQRIHRDYIDSTLYETWWTKNKDGEWINEKGNEWPEYSKKTYFELATE
ncbi:hypothetical protein FOXG_21548 [Fusarium oxysporum f. sp. lycopersici 4287]|uniref:Uncharacterized protein n=1 Tax=Fusarium oxysporum f. sp. lycopersici (strain 4287 / CBS 123668 / FGSC 9935 / NRRL 34936) TaxID=426428 RepID=A0A0J9WTG1_FUSO4|nr:hypothetical protein FOXG_21548 [Fusarium oxysporum f. sp. lycopersici 4287]KNB15972.1 hypothetical protein FOXG_21548 [Fusarium oxysporum f. sp. lycopersici 4287]